MGKKHSGRREHDIHARREGPEKLRFNEKDMANICPMTHTQQEAFNAFYEENHLAMLGSAGTGKTFIGMYLGLKDVLKRYYSKMIIIRSATPSKDIGFLPGSLEEKMQVYEQPYKIICDALLPKHYNNYDNLKKKEYIDFMSTSYLRGLTFDDAIILIDEFQNLSMAEFHTVMTRIGENSRLIICGDVLQTDLDKRNQPDWAKLIKTINNMPSVESVYFTRNDIVRSGLVKEWLNALEDTGMYSSIAY